MDKMEKVDVMERLVEEMGARKTAEFILSLQDVADDLSYHNHALLRMYYSALTGGSPPPGVENGETPGTVNSRPPAASHDQCN